MGNDNKPYTYLIGWRERDLWYYGSRHANTLAPEEDLWKEYFTSSKYVEKAREEFGEPDVRLVHRIFETVEDTHRYEYKFLKRVNAKSSPRWLNQTIMGAPMGGTPNQVAWAKKPKSEETKAKMREAAKRRWANDEINRQRASEFLKANNPAYASGRHCRIGLHHSEESKAKMRETQLRLVEERKTRGLPLHGRKTRSEAQQARRRRELEKKRGQS